MRKPECGRARAKLGSKRGPGRIAVLALGFTVFGRIVCGVSPGVPGVEG